MNQYNHEGHGSVLLSTDSTAPCQVMQMLSWPWKVGSEHFWWILGELLQQRKSGCRWDVSPQPLQVPMLNLTDCIISFCIVLLVTTSTLYLNQIESHLQDDLRVSDLQIHQTLAVLWWSHILWTTIDNCEQFMLLQSKVPKIAQAVEH